MQSELFVVRGLAACIFQDIGLMYPSIQLGLRRDLSRLHKADSVSGLPLYTITLPLMSKFLERSLDQGCLETKRPPLLGAKSKVDFRPQFLWDLWSKIFEMDGTLRCDDADVVASLRQIFLFAKKLRINCEERRNIDAVSQFREIERSLPPSWDHTWDDDHPRWTRRFGHPLWGNYDLGNGDVDLFDADPMHEYDRDLDWDGFRSFAARIVSQFGVLDFLGVNQDANESGDKPSNSVDPFMLHPKHGPGAISDKSDHTKYDHKYWTWRLEPFFPYDYYGAPAFDSEHIRNVVYREFPSRLHAVPKTQSGPRLIAAEPTAHQWCQGAIRRFLEDKCNETVLSRCIDFRSQHLSQVMAREGSLTGEYATIDLSSASDRLTTRLVEYCFQSNRSLLDALHASRTRVVSLNKSDDREIILLRKFATQGSAVTFPVQTIVYTLLALWSVYLSRKRSGEQREPHRVIEELADQVRVFGDDIIVPTHAYSVLRRILSSVRLVVNESKSFSQGKFRESCGMDAYAGADVTPSYFRQLYSSKLPESIESIIQCSNNFFKKGYWNAAVYIQQTVPQEELRLFPFVRHGSGTLGLVSFSGDSVAHLPRRWNRDLQRFEFKVLCLKNEAKKQHGKGSGDLTQFFYDFHHSSSLVGINPYSSGQSTAPNSSKRVRWVGIDDMPEADSSF